MRYVVRPIITPKQKPRFLVCDTETGAAAKFVREAVAVAARDRLEAGTSVVCERCGMWIVAVKDRQPNQRDAHRCVSFEGAER